MEKETATKRLGIAFLLNLGFTIFELVGGFLTNSVALLSDAIHDLGDAFSIGIAVVFEKKANRKPDHVYTYGYRRFSLLGALIASIGLVIGASFVISESIQRLLAPEPVSTLWLVFFALFGMVVNSIAAIVTHKGHSENEKIISLHMFEDVIGWAVLLVGAIIMHFTGFMVLDAILSILFTLYILTHVYRHLKKIIAVLMEKAPTHPSIMQIRDVLASNQHVANIHHVHYWSLEGEKGLFTAHVVLKDDRNEDNIWLIQKELHQSLQAIGLLHATLEFETEADCMDTCE